MDRIKLSFLVVFAVLLVEVLIEVVNPHSFLGTIGAFARMTVLLVGAVLWYIFFKNTQSKLVKTGVAVLVIGAVLFFFYGLNSYCQDTYYEINREAFANSRTDIEPYSCPRIILGLLSR